MAKSKASNAKTNKSIISIPEFSACEALNTRSFFSRHNIDMFCKKADTAQMKRPTTVVLKFS